MYYFPPSPLTFLLSISRLHEAFTIWELLPCLSISKISYSLFFLDILKNRLWSKVRPKHLYLSLETTHTSFEPNPQLSNIYTRYGTQIHFFQLDRWNLDQNFVLRNEASFCGTNPHPSTNNPWNGLSFHRTELRSVERCSFPMGTE